MTIYLFHGDNLTATRQDLQQFILASKTKGHTLTHLDGKKITLPELELALASTSLFEQNDLVIENLFSRPRSKALDSLIQMIASYKGEKDLALWDKKELTKTRIKKFPKGTINKLHKAPVLIFKLLDSFTPNSIPRTLKEIRDASKDSDEGFIYIMLTRRVSELIIAKSGDTSKLSPWIRSRLLSQVRSWQESQLLQLHKALTEFDYKLKTGQTKLSYLEGLDIILSSLVR